MTAEDYIYEGAGMIRARSSLEAISYLVAKSARRSEVSELIDAEITKTEREAIINGNYSVHKDLYPEWKGWDYDEKQKMTRAEREALALEEDILQKLRAKDKAEREALNAEAI